MRVLVAVVLSIALPTLAGEEVARLEPFVDDGRVPYRVAVWAQPIMAVVAGVGFSVSQGEPFLYLPFGMNIALGPHVDLAVELSGLSATTGCGVDLDQICRERGFFASVGPSIRPFTGAGRGFFLQPKAQLFWDAHGATEGWAVGVALDVGWQFVWGPVYFAPVLGVGLFPRATGPTQDYVYPVGNSMGLSFNLNLLRVGFAF